MKRTTVMLPDDVEARLRVEARRRGVPIASVVREAVESHLAPERTGQPLSFFAIAPGGPPDASEHVDQYVAAALKRSRQKR